jgi:hypothetical protein
LHFSTEQTKQFDRRRRFNSHQFCEVLVGEECEFRIFYYFASQTVGLTIDSRRKPNQAARTQGAMQPILLVSAYSEAQFAFENQEASSALVPFPKEYDVRLS